TTLSTASSGRCATPTSSGTSEAGGLSLDLVHPAVGDAEELQLAGELAVVVRDPARHAGEVLERGHQVAQLLAGDVVARDLQRLADQRGRVERQRLDLGGRVAKGALELLREPDDLGGRAAAIEDVDEDGAARVLLG